MDGALLDNTSSEFIAAQAVPNTGRCAYEDLLPNPDDPEERHAFAQFCLKVTPCPMKCIHDWSRCPYAHSGEKAARRDPRVYNYTGVACSAMKKDGKCPRGDSCPYAHSDWEYWLHPTRYHTALCKRGAACQRKICFFAHDPSELRTPSVRPGLRASSTRSKMSSARRQQQQQQLAQAAAGAGSSPEQQEQPGAVQLMPITAMESWSLSSSGSSDGGSPTAVGGLAWMEALGRGEPLVGLGPGLEQLTGVAPGGLSIRTSACSAAAAGAAPALVGLSSPSSLAAGSELPLAVTPSAPGSPWCLDDSTRAVMQVVAGDLAQGRMDAAQAALVLGRLLPPQAMQQLELVLGMMQQGPPALPQMELTALELPNAGLAAPAGQAPAPALAEMLSRLRACGLEPAMLGGCVPAPKPNALGWLGAIDWGV